MENNFKDKTDLELLKIFIETPINDLDKVIYYELENRGLINNKTTIREIELFYETLKAEKQEEERLTVLYKADVEWKYNFLKENPEYIDDGDFWESHSCSAFESGGYCDWCGADLGGGDI